MKRKSKINKVIKFLIILIASIMIVGSVYYKINYPKQEFEEIIFYLQNGVEHIAPSIVNNVIFICIIPVIILTFILWIPTTEFKRNIKFKILKKEIKIYPCNKILNHINIYLITIFIIGIVFVICLFGIHIYVYNQFQTTQIFENYYIDGQTVNISFPEEKRNLILIVAESMENTLCTEGKGGIWEYPLIPELEKLAQENINFSNTEKIGGGYQLYGNTFTAGGLVGATAGIPLITPIDANNYLGEDSYLENAYTLGDILKEQGYNLEMIMGSDGTFGGRTQYFTTNGEYKIFDVNYAIETGKMKESDKEWWGFEDDKLFEWSKEEITNLASQNKPFNYIMLTADTHFVDGYLSKNAEDKFERRYENVYAYSSKSIYEFVKWIKKQEFYKNTTIVIIGDHLGMQTEFYEEDKDNEYVRTVYNVIINSSTEGQNTTNREFTTVDMYPTILASIGVNIEGERIGLGTNLFSGKKTLVEELGYDYINNELKKNSKFYRNYILGNNYYLMKKRGREIKEEVNNT